MSIRKLVIVLFLLCSTSLYADGEPGKFDYYVMSLSWSPDYCAYIESKGKTDPNQCTDGKKLGFVLHGLWPQYIKGFPSDCTTEKMPADVIENYTGLYPSEKLYSHEWEKHGTCSGLTPEQYLTLTKQLKDALVIPANYLDPIQPFRTSIDELKKDFIAANPRFNDKSLAPACSGSGRFLQELRVCYNKDGQVAECSPEVLGLSRKSCGKPDFLVRNIK